MSQPLRHCRGFTLVEMIVVIVLMGIIGGMVAIFIKAPVQGYVDSARRAELTDIADTALRRLARDIRTAVPNSVRLSGNYLEFLPTVAGGRYRGDAGTSTVCSGVAGNSGGDGLNFDAVDSCFEIIGPPITFTAGDQVVIGSTQSSGAPPYADCALTPANCIRRPIAAAGVGANQQAVKMTSTTTFPAFAEVPGQRFDVVPGTQGAVTYGCVGVGSSGGDGTGTLTRYWGYGYKPSQIAPPTGGTTAILADKVSDCTISYDAVNQRTGLVTIQLGITRGGESVRLLHQVHVNNIP